MSFPVRLVELRKKSGHTQQSLADAIELHVNQIKRYEADTAQPTLDTLTRLAKSLHVILDELVFEETDRGPDEDLRLQFEAVTRFSPEEKKIAKAVLESLILKRDSNRFSATNWQWPMDSITILNGMRLRHKVISSSMGFHLTSRLLSLMTCS